MNSAGSAEQENAIYMESLEGKLNNLNSAWQNFARNTINSEVIKSLLTLGTKLIELADTDIGRLLISITALASATAILKKAFTSLEIVKSTTSIFRAFREEMALQAALAPTTAASMNTFTTATAAAKIGVQGLTAAMLANPLFWVAAGGLAIYGITKAVDALNVTYEEQIEKVNKASEAYEKAKRDLDENTNSLEEKRKKLEEINKLEQTEPTNKYEMQKKDLESEIKTLEAKQKVLENIAKEEKEAEDREAKKALQKKESITSTAVVGQAFADTELPATKLQKVNLEIENYNKLIALKSKLTQGAFESDENFAKRQEEVQQKIDGVKSSIAYTANDLLDLKDKLDTSTESGKEYADQIDEAVETANNFADSLNNQNEELSLQDEYMQGVIEEEKEYQARLKDRLTLTDDNKEKINDEIDNMQSAYSTLNSAIEEYNSAGGITMETLQSLLALDGNYLNSLELVNGKLQINAESEKSHSEMIEQDTMALIENAAMNDLQAMASEASGTTAQSAAQKIQNAGENAKSAGEYAKQGAAGFTELAGAMAQAGMVNLDGVDVEGWANKWAGITEKIKGLTSGKSALTSPKFTGGSSSGKKSGGSGKKSGSSKSTKEEYKAEIDTLYAYKNALDNAKDAVDRLNDALDDTDNFNEQERILKQLIDATNNQINKTNELKNAQTSQMNDYINQLRAQGFAIDYNASKNELFINNMQHLADFSGDTAKNLEKLIKKIQDLNDDNRSLDSSVRDLTSDVKDYYEQLADIPEKKLKKFNELMEDFQQSRLDQIQNQIDDIQHEMENDPRLKQLENQIEALEKQNDELDNQKELEEKLLAVEEAKEKLANARRQKTLQVYREGQGFVWESDIDSIKEAADELKDAQDDLNEKIKQDEIDRLQAEKDALEKSYQDRIDALQAFLDEQNYQIDKANREGIQSFQDLQKELAKFGLDSAEYLGKASDWLNNYNKALSDLNTTVNGILSSSTTATDGLIYSSAVQDRINQALSNIIPDTTMAGLTLSNIDYDKIKGNTDNQSIYINNIELPNVKDVDDFVAALKDLPRMATSQSTSRE